MHWAWNRKGGSPSAKIILMCLADFANQDAECFPSIAHLAEKTEQSPNTVRRRLQELEDDGLIERRAQYRPNGSQTVDLIRLKMGQEEPTKVSAGEFRPPTKLRGGPLPNLEGDPPAVERAPLPTVVPPEPPYEPPLEPTPLAPHGGMGVGSSHETQFDAFRDGWGEHGAGASWPKALSAWSQLSAADRAEALLCLPRYLDDCRAKSRKVCHPATYLTERRWEGFRASPAATDAAPRPEPDAVTKAVAWARSPACRDDGPFIAEGTTEWDAWRSAFRHAGYAFPSGTRTLVDVDGEWEHRIGRHFPMASPPPLPG